MLNHSTSIFSESISVQTVITILLTLVLMLSAADASAAPKSTANKNVQSTPTATPGNTSPKLPDAPMLVPPSRSQLFVLGNPPPSTSSKESSSYSSLGPSPSGNSGSICNLNPVSNSVASFTPIRIMNSSETNVTGVTDAGVIVGNYRELPNYNLRSYRAVTNASGGYSNVDLLSKGGYYEAQGLNISNNGNTVVGYVCPTGGCSCGSDFSTCKRRAVRWDPPFDSAQPLKLSRLGAPTGGCQNPSVPCDSEAVKSEAVAVSNDGSVIAGFYATSQVDAKITRWMGSGAGTPESIINPFCYPGVICYSAGLALNGSGSRMTGFYLEYPSNAIPFLWDAGQPNITTLSPLNNSPRRELPYGISPEGLSVVGQGLNGDSISSGAVPPLVPAVAPNNYIPSGGPIYYVDEATTWKQTDMWSPTTAGDLADFPNQYFRTLFDSRFTDTSSGGTRSVGRSYGGGELMDENDPTSSIEGSEDTRTAIIFPSFGGNPHVSRLKDELRNYFQLDIDALNPLNPLNSQPYHWQLIDATTISPDGNTIAGMAVCHGGIDGIIYGFVIHVSSAPIVKPDFDSDGDVDSDDYVNFIRCLGLLPTSPAADCVNKDLNSDSLIDELDAAIFSRCFSGTNVPVDPLCYSEPSPYFPSIPGDFDGDGVITNLDFERLQTCRGEDPQTNQYCLPTDLTEDGIIDTGDLEAFLDCLDSNTPLCYSRPPRISLSNETSYPAGRAPTRLVLADFDLDGNLDTASLQGFAGSVQIRSGTGTGQLGNPWPPFSHYGFSADIKSGNFDQLGFPDLVLAGGQGVFIYLNTGEPGFMPSAPSSYTTGTNVRSVTVADFNGDYYSDLATVDKSSHGKLVILRGTGNGRFNPLVTLDLPYGSLIESSDIDSDGDQDIVTVSNNHRVSIFKNNGHAEFSLAQTIDLRGFTNPISNVLMSSGVVFGLVVEDFNSDGALDIAVTGTFSETPSGTTDNQVYILKNLGNGSGQMQWPGFLDAVNQVTSRTNPLSLTSADFNGDGRPDLALGGESNAIAPGEFVVMLGASSSLGGVEIFNRVTVGYGTRSIQAGDFNNDGMPDLAAVNAIPASDSISLVLTQIGESPITFATPVPYSAGDAARHLIVADLNTDGLIDVASSGRYSSSVDVRLNSPGNPGTLGSSQQYALPDATSLEVADFGSDGILDLACISPNTDTLGLLYGTGSGQFAPASTLATEDQPGNVVRNDLNNDGRIDLLVSNSRGSTLTYFAGLSQGGGFTQISIPGIPRGDLTVADFNRDGKQDIALAPFSNAVKIYMGDGTGAISHYQDPPTGSGSYESVAGDFDRDGILDLAVTGWNSGDVTILRGLGNGQFDSIGRYLVGEHPQGLGRGDFDNDGFLDLAIVSNGFSKVTVLRGRKGMGFGWAGTYAVGKGVQRVAVTDINRDGHLDFITVDAISDSISVALGTP